MKVALSGLGFVGRSVLELLHTRADILRELYGLQVMVTAVADSKGAALNPGGLDVAALQAHKLATGRVDSFAGGIPGMDVVSMLTQAEAEALLEASPVDLKTGGAGLAAARAALARGRHVVFANKGPLVLAYSELHQLAGQRSAKLAFSATVCGSLPVIDILRRELVACRVISLAGIFNSTTNYILTAMSTGRSFDVALAEAQRAGIAETDPSLDIDGWDTANKLVIIMNTLLNQPVTLKDLSEVTGIRKITQDDIQAAQKQGMQLRLLASAKGRKQEGVLENIRHETLISGKAEVISQSFNTANDWLMTVKPTPIPVGHPLAAVSGWEMGIWIETDTMGTQFYQVDERGPLPTAAAVLRDLVNLYA